MPTISCDLLDIVESDTSTTIAIGSTLPFYDNGKFVIGDKQFSHNGLTTNGSKNKENIVHNAMMFLNAPYLWGGRSPLGIDCSGFTQIAYKLQGIEIPRDAYQQAEIGTTLSFVEESEPGDLAFFDNNEGKITHVGIILKDNFIIHASGKVRIDRIDQQGIFNAEEKKHTHKLRLIKSVF
jgi:cell wall-associated NlpC family hydrolase